MSKPTPEERGEVAHGDTGLACYLRPEVLQLEEGGRRDCSWLEGGREERL